MIESRCGIVCGECDYREKMNCRGCVSIDMPFWGERCPLKDCCEKRALENCGFCAEFPCELLNKYAFDKEHGDEGKRIKQCAAWANHQGT